MPTKTARILNLLPATFKPLPPPTALFALADAFGNELQQAENSLAAIMAAHWVDKADQSADLIADLACIAALYGLTPRGATPAGPQDGCSPVISDEGIEEFRAHLKRYVRMLLDGTVSVRGILRVVAEALGLTIADGYDVLDAWWNRRDDVLVDTVPRGDDAARRLFGADEIRAEGRDAAPARVRGLVDLSRGVDLVGASILRINVGTSQDVDLAALVPHPSSAQLSDIVLALNQAVGVNVASAEGAHLLLASPIVGPTSVLEVGDVDGDAAPALLGLLPRRYVGADATPPRLTGTVDLAVGADLSEVRYLRIQVDRARLAEIDCAGALPSASTPAEVTAAINKALGPGTATHDGHYLTLTSTTTGFGGSVALYPPAAQDATARLFGEVPSMVTGHESRPALAIGRVDLSGGIDLSARSKVRVQLDTQPPTTIDCVGATASKTSIDEIVAALNKTLPGAPALHDGKFVQLKSSTTGKAGLVAFDAPRPQEDATELIFGIGPRRFGRVAAASARLTGTTDLSGGTDLAAQRWIGVRLDGGSLRTIDAAAAAANPRTAPLGEIVTALTNSLGAGVASHDGRHLILVSTTSGASSHVTIEPLSTTRRRRFTTRASVTGEAADQIFGFSSASAQGSAGRAAQVLGAADLGRGVDLRPAPYLRVAVDGSPAVDVDCSAGVLRPHAALPAEIVAAINAGLGAQVASSPDSQHLVLTSPTTGVASSIRLEPARAGDALVVVLDLPPGILRGQDATRVRFTSTVDLVAGLDLTAGALVKLAVDGGTAVELSLAGANPARTLINEIVASINQAFSAQLPTLATHDAKYITLASGTTGAASRLEFMAPSGHDATAAVFGIAPPRSYHGSPPVAAQATGRRDLHAGVDLRIARHLQIAVDGQPAVVIDCAAQATDPAKVSLNEIVKAIEAVAAGIATAQGPHLVVTSKTPGAASMLDLRPYSAGDARSVLLGTVSDTSIGSDATPATITGVADLSTPINLGDRALLRLAVEGGRPVDVDVAGTSPQQTAAAEIRDAIDRTLPHLARLTPDNHLQLVSPSAGETSSLKVLALRTIELTDFPPVPVPDPAVPAPAPQLVRHGDHLTIDNNGAAASRVRVEMQAPSGIVGPSIANQANGRRFQVMRVIKAGELLRVWPASEAGIAADIVGVNGAVRAVDGAQILSGPIGPEAMVPYDGARRLGGGSNAGPASLTLNNPLAPAVVVLRVRDPGVDGNRIRVTVKASAPPIADRFDVGIDDASRAMPAESYAAVSIGSGVESPDSLLRQLLARPSSLVHGLEVDKAASLHLPCGRTQLTYLDCYGSRFNQVSFGAAYFAGGRCLQRGIFDFSRFAVTPADDQAAVFVGAEVEPQVELRTFWNRYQPGSFVVNLPADLPDGFGGRFNAARFAKPASAAEEYKDTVLEPATDPQYLVKLLATSSLVTASAVGAAAGATAVTIPFRGSRSLAGGTDSQPAAIVVREAEGTSLIKFEARQPGDWGNGIALRVRKAGPAMFDVAVEYDGARFENARQLVLGKPESALVADLVKPGPMTILQSKAAGVEAAVTRDGAERPDPI
jgi:hypothetical protein